MGVSARECLPQTSTSSARNTVNHCPENGGLSGASWRTNVDCSQLVTPSSWSTHPSIAISIHDSNPISREGTAGGGKIKISILSSSRSVKWDSKDGTQMERVCGYVCECSCASG